MTVNKNKVTWYQYYSSLEHLWWFPEEINSSHDQMNAILEKEVEMLEQERMFVSSENRIFKDP